MCHGCMLMGIEFNMIISIIMAIIFNLLIKRQNNKGIFFNIFIYTIIAFILNLSLYIPMIIIVVYVAFNYFNYNEKYDIEPFNDYIMYTILCMLVPIFASAN